MSADTHFTGTVEAQSLAVPAGDSLLAVYAVTFQPGARTHWHSHPRGQGLYVTQGVARVQISGSSPQTLRTGESIWIPAGERHWHGADAAGPMTHLAYQQADADGSTVHWHEPVTDHDYHHTKENH